MNGELPNPDTLRQMHAARLNAALDPVVTYRARITDREPEGNLSGKGYTIALLLLCALVAFAAAIGLVILAGRVLVNWAVQ